MKPWACGREVEHNKRFKRRSLNGARALSALRNTMSVHVSVVKPFGFYTQAGTPEKFELIVNNLGLSISRVNFKVSLIGDMQETQDVINYCEDNKVHTQIEIIKAKQINDARENVVNKKVRQCR